MMINSPSLTCIANILCLFLFLFPGHTTTLKNTKKQKQTRFQYRRSSKRAYKKLIRFGQEIERDNSTL